MPPLEIILPEHVEDPETNLSYTELRSVKRKYDENYAQGSVYDSLQFSQQTRHSFVAQSYSIPSPTMAYPQFKCKNCIVSFYTEEALAFHSLSHTDTRCFTNDLHVLLSAKESVSYFSIVILFYI